MDPDTQVAHLSEQDVAAVRLANSIYNDPKLRPRMQELIKEKYPQAQIPEYDARAAVLPEIVTLRERLDASEKSRVQEQQSRAWREAIGDLKTDPRLRLRDDEEAGLVDLMKNEHIGSPRAAAELMRARAHVAAPTRVTYDASMRMPGHKGAGGDEYKGLWEDRTNWFRTRTADIMTDFANGLGSKWA